LPRVRLCGRNKKEMSSRAGVQSSAHTHTHTPIDMGRNGLRDQCWATLGTARGAVAWASAALEGAVCIAGGPAPVVGSVIGFVALLTVVLATVVLVLAVLVLSRDVVLVLPRGLFRRLFAARCTVVGSLFLSRLGCIPVVIAGAVGWFLGVLGLDGR